MVWIKVCSYCVLFSAALLVFDASTTVLAVLFAVFALYFFSWRGGGSF